MQMWLVGLQAAPKQAQKTWAQREAQNAAADRNTLIALHDRLPWSVRPLLGLDTLRGTVQKARTVLDMYDQAIEQAAPGSAQRAFLEAGRQATIERSGGRVH